MTSKGSSDARKIIIGHANTFHDSAIAVICGDVVYAESIERHQQCKRAVGTGLLFYSSGSLRRVLTKLGVLPLEKAEVTYRSAWSEVTLKDMLKHRLEAPPRELQSMGEFDMIVRLELGSVGMRSVVERQLEWVLREAINHRLEAASEVFPPNRDTEKSIAWKTELTDHHLCHVANAVYTSPFDECVVMVSDAVAEGPALTFHHFANDSVRTLSGPMPENAVSLGILYMRVTELCGFGWVEGEEWKVMGLAAYGKPDPRIREVFERSFAVDGLWLVDKHPKGWYNGIAEDLLGVLGKFRHPADAPIDAAQLAHNFQAWYTDMVCELIGNAAKLGVSKNLAISGGSGLNSTTNGKLVGRTGFDRVHVPCAPADDGNALGAALYEKHMVRKEPRKPGILSPYLGSFIDMSNLDRILSFGGLHHWEAPDEATLCAEVAKILAAGKIIGWVQGRAEYGPRALGNRSILADPRPKTMKDEINRRVKFREEYRPLAPSILHEHGPTYFESYQESPYMERTLTFRPEVREKVPAVVHVDGTGRLQSVKKEYNERFHRLITAFHELTGIPLLLNTSFNVMGKPIVHSTADAITVLFTTDLDHLVIDRHVIAKRLPVREPAR